MKRRNRLWVLAAFAVAVGGACENGANSPTAPNPAFGLSPAIGSVSAVTGILFDNGSSSGPQSNFGNTTGFQELFEDFTLGQNSVITTIRWQQHDHNTATYLTTEVLMFAGLPFDGPPLFSSTIIADRMPNATGTLFGAWDGFDYEISGLSINLPPGTYWLGLNANFQGIRPGWDNTTGGPNTIPGFRIVNNNFPAPGLVSQGSNLAFTLFGTAGGVEIDIKPGSDPNSIICNDENVSIAVAILTTDDFDATTVDHTTVTFEGASETHLDKKSGQPRRHEEDVDGDGDTDLVFHFRLGDTDLTCGSTDGTLTGETFDGQAIEGTDAVRMIDEGGGPA